jgi:hypothetical protein
MSPGSSVSVPVTIVAPTETVIFTITSLPAGVSQNYKESESNPSGLLTLQANSLTKPGTYKPTIVVSTSGQTASLVFTLVVTAMSARAPFPSTDSQGTIQMRPVQVAGTPLPALSKVEGSRFLKLWIRCKTAPSRQKHRL